MITKIEVSLTKAEVLEAIEAFVKTKNGIAYELPVGQMDSFSADTTTDSTVFVATHETRKD